MLFLPVSAHRLQFKKLGEKAALSKILLWGITFALKCGKMQGRLASGDTLTIKVKDSSQNSTLHFCVSVVSLQW